MERRIERTLPWRYRLFPELVRLAWPIAISTLSYSVMTLVGTLFVGRLGASALAGVGLGGVACFTLLCFGFGALRGVNVLVSQAHGAGDRERAGTWLWTGLALALVLGVVMLGAGQLLASQIHRLASSPTAGAHAADYVAVRMLGAPLVMLFVALREHRYGQGDSRSAMAAAVAGNLVNMALDWLLIVELAFGVVGAAWATIGGISVEVLVIVWVQARDEWRPRAVRLSDLRELLAVGLPTGIQFWMEVGSW
jgi:MATE family multidrug resistance protein